MLLQQYAGKERPHGRPNWVKEPLPNVSLCSCITSMLCMHFKLVICDPLLPKNKKLH